MWIAVVVLHRQILQALRRHRLLLLLLLSLDHELHHAELLVLHLPDLHQLLLLHPGIGRLELQVGVALLLLLEATLLRLELCSSVHLLHVLRLLVVNSLDLASLHELRPLVEQHRNFFILELLYCLTSLFWLSLELLHDDPFYLLKVCHQRVLGAEMLLKELFAGLQLTDCSLKVAQLL